ncbi:MAG: non-canonical purine NTP diphosphatase [Bacteroidales bacterium]|nr:non-canonical purine NTP diphosphatase [Bacteroidales bacterium]
MRQIVFATNNAHKMAEVSGILCSEIKLLSLKDIQCLDELPETQETIEGNALQKARYVYEKFGMDCFADDTGLLVDILDGAPGVYSARYAGEACDSENNIKKLLAEMHGKTNRKACFKTVAALILEGKEYLFEGKISGTILTERRGSSGFGYDPVFLPDGYDRSFAQMDMELKNRISHRALAMKSLSVFLNQ